MIVHLYWFNKMVLSEGLEYEPMTHRSDVLPSFIGHINLELSHVESSYLALYGILIHKGKIMELDIT